MLPCVCGDLVFTIYFVGASEALQGQRARVQELVEQTGRTDDSDAKALEVCLAA